MITARLRSSFFESPESLLALSLSAPSQNSGQGLRSVTIDFEDEDVNVRVKRPVAQLVAPRIVATKQTIAAGILLHHVISERGPEYASSVIERAERFGEMAARRNADLPPEIALDFEPRAPFPGSYTRDFFHEFLDVSEKDFELANRKTLEAFEFLENEGLAVDPAFTPEMMVLLGFVPMHFSVRTPKGERIYREIKVNAPLWSLSVTRGSKSDRPFTDVEFHFRGIEIVRRAITAMATQYLESEGYLRKSKGQRALKLNAAPELDRE